MFVPAELATPFWPTPMVNASMTKRQPRWHGASLVQIKPVPAA
jgi:hypothetical protein